MTAVEPPVVPDADTARRWAEDELSGSEYSAGGGNWLMDAIEWLVRAISDTAEGAARGLGPVGTVLAVVIALAVLAGIAWLLVGPLRRSRRAAAVGDLFEDERSAAALAGDASRAATAGDWATATAELYRALIRMLAERSVIDLSPGVTAHEAAVEAGGALPTLAVRVMADADAFDRVRYGDGRASEQDYAHVRATYEDARTARRTVEATA